MLDGLSEVSGSSQHWAHILPFAALIAGRPVPENRPAMTRIIEQSFVGIIAAAVGSFATIQVHQAEITALKAQRQESEARTTAALINSETRLTAQIAELRAVMLQKK